jgi:hypothetical protein
LVFASSRQSFLQLVSVFAVATIAGCGRVDMNQWIASAPSAVLPMP